MNLLSLIALFRALNGDIEQAKIYLDKARKLFFLNEESEGWGEYQVTKSIIALEQGDYEQAHTLMEGVLLQSEKSGNRFDYLWTKARLGHLALRGNELSQARMLFEETIKAFQETELIGVVFTLEGMAGILIATGNPKNAARLIGWGDAMRRKIKDSRPLLEQRR